MAQKLIIGIDLGGSKINTLLAESQGGILKRELQDTLAAEGPDAVIGRIVSAAGRLAAGANVDGVGIAAAGACDHANGIVTISPNLPGWHNIPLRDILQRELNLPVYLENDTSAAALGEHIFGGGVGVDHLIYVGVGTGIGGGMIIDGRLYRGASGSAGEIGHMTIDVNGPRCSCGNVGCWETFASGTALERRARARIEDGAKTAILDIAGGDIDSISGEVVFRAAQGGDLLAGELIASIGYYLGVGLANLVNIFNPQLILIGGGLAQMGPLLLDPAAEVVRERAFELPAQAVRIETAKLGGDAGALGAVALALQSD